jgi:hypothetical protein
MIKNLFIIVCVIDGKEYAIRHRAKTEKYYIAIGDNAFMDNSGADMVIGVSQGNVMRENPGKEFFEKEIGIQFDDFYVKQFTTIV